jgi:alpha-galactosidase
MPIIKHGISRRFGQIGPSWRHPCGWQGVVRTNLDQTAALIVIHAFAKPPAQAQILLQGPNWRITDQFHADDEPVRIVEDQLIWPTPSEFRSAVVLLSRPSTSSSKKTTKRPKP